MPVKKRYVQGAYISSEAKEALKKEALRRGDFPTTFVSEILEKKARELIRKEQEHGQDS